MRIALREDFDPDVDFYYRYQFRIYHEPYLIWDEETWKSVLATCTVYRIEVEGKVAGDVVLEDRGKGAKSIVDFSILPEYQGKGIGKAVLERVKKMGKALTAVTRKETLNFFLKSGFVLKRTIRNYYDSGVDGYLIVFQGMKNGKGGRVYSLVGSKT
jgi:ribosomal protein S18 acetylase RimI-like enzyme